MIGGDALQCDNSDQTCDVSSELSPIAAQNGLLHHLGFVVASIPKAAEQFALITGTSWNGKVVHDPLQRVYVSFLAPQNSRNPMFELVEPAGDTSPVSNLVKKGGGLHHVCYEVDDLDQALCDAKACGLAVVSAPQPAVAFDGRRIAWVCSRNRLLMEFLEREKK